MSDNMNSICKQILYIKNKYKGQLEQKGGVDKVLEEFEKYLKANKNNNIAYAAILRSLGSDQDSFLYKPEEFNFSPRGTEVTIYRHGGEEFNIREILALYWLVAKDESSIDVFINKIAEIQRKDNRGEFKYSEVDLPSHSVEKILDGLADSVSYDAIVKRDIEAGSRKLQECIDDFNKQVEKAIKSFKKKFDLSTPKGKQLQALKDVKKELSYVDFTNISKLEELTNSAHVFIGIIDNLDGKFKEIGYPGKIRRALETIKAKIFKTINSIFGINLLNESKTITKEKFNKLGISKRKKMLSQFTINAKNSKDPKETNQSMDNPPKFN